MRDVFITYSYGTYTITFREAQVVINHFRTDSAVKMAVVIQTWLLGE